MINKKSSKGCSPITVTKTFLPRLETYVRHLEGIWKRGWVTNHGPLVLQLEERLKEFLGVKHLFFMANGTLALEIALRASAVEGEVITTPFSYVATTSSLAWVNCRPRFADIDRRSLCIDPAEIENRITSRTRAILATHVYGIPCAVERIASIAQRHGLRVIYDAAHAFGVKYRRLSLLCYGDVSTLSFHATKLFHTIEGGAVVTNDDDLAHRISYMRNFGHRGEEAFWGLGINGKNSEFHAAMGLCLLPQVRRIIARRKRVSAWYDRLLAETDLEKPQAPKNTESNYGYYPVIFPSENHLLIARSILNQDRIFPRRYFYPSLNTLNYVSRDPMPVTDDVSRRILCLPLYFEMTYNDVLRVVRGIREVC